MTLLAPHSDTGSPRPPDWLVPWLLPVRQAPGYEDRSATPVWQTRETVRLMRQRYEKKRKVYKDRLIARDGYLCAACGAWDVDLCVDHVMPLLYGGTNRPGNLQLLCGPCNTSKGHKPPSEWSGPRA